MAELNEKQKRFCEEYIIDFNGTQAAIRAGYSARTANEQSSQLLVKLNIQEYIQELIEERKKRTEISQDRVLLEIARLAFNDPRKAFYDDGRLKNIHEWPDEVAAAISSIEIVEDKLKDSDLPYESTVKKIRFWDKGKQIELAAKHLGMLNEKLMLQGDRNNPLQFVTAKQAEKMAKEYLIAKDIPEFD